MATAQRNTNYNQKLFLIFLPYQAFEEVETDLQSTKYLFFFVFLNCGTL